MKSVRGGSGRLPAKLKIYYEQHFQRFGIRVVYAKDDFKNDGTIGDDITQMVKHSGGASEFSVGSSPSQRSVEPKAIHD